MENSLGAARTWEHIAVVIEHGESVAVLSVRGRRSCSEVSAGMENRAPGPLVLNGFRFWSLDLVAVGCNACSCALRPEVDLSLLKLNQPEMPGHGFGDRIMYRYPLI
jgi:hypothetical protein